MNVCIDIYPIARDGKVKNFLTIKNTLLLESMGFTSILLPTIG